MRLFELGVHALLEQDRAATPLLATSLSAMMALREGYPLRITRAGRDWKSQIPTISPSHGIGSSVTCLPGVPSLVPGAFLILMLLSESGIDSTGLES